MSEDTLNNLLTSVLDTRKYSPEFKNYLEPLIDLCVQLRRPRNLRETLNKVRFVCGSPTMVESLRSYGFSSVFTPLEEALHYTLTRIAADSTLTLSESADFYRSCFEAIRHSAPVSHLFKDIAQAAFSYCLAHNATLELRHLADHFRAHLKQLFVNQDPSLLDRDFVSNHISARLIQLDVAVKLKVWSEAHKLIRDVSQLFNLPGYHHKFAVSIVSSYLENVLELLWETKNYRFYTILGLQLTEFIEEPRTNLANNILISAVCSLFNPNEATSVSTRTSDLVLFDHFSAIMTIPVGSVSDQSFLIAIDKKVRQFADKDHQSLFDTIVVNQNVQVENVWNACKAAVGDNEDVKRIVWLKIFDLISKNQNSIDFDRLSSLIGVDESKISSDLFLFFAHSSLISIRTAVRVCFLSKTLVFSVPALISSKLLATNHLFKKSREVLTKINHQFNLKQHKLLVNSVKLALEEEHVRQVDRKRIINERKSALEQLERDRLQEQYRLEQEKVARMQKAQEDLLAAEQEKRRLERIAREQAKKLKQQEEREAQRAAEEAKRKAEQEKVRKLERMLRRHDFLQRAIRREEIGLRRAEQENLAKAAEEKWNKHVEEMKERRRKEWEEALVQKKRLAPIMQFAAPLLASIREEQRANGLIKDEPEVSAEQVELKQKEDEVAALLAQKKEMKAIPQPPVSEERLQIDTSLLVAYDAKAEERHAESMKELLARRKIRTQATVEPVPVTSTVTAAATISSSAPAVVEAKDDEVARMLAQRIAKKAQAPMTVEPTITTTPLTTTVPSMAPSVAPVLAKDDEIKRKMMERKQKLHASAEPVAPSVVQPQVPTHLTQSAPVAAAALSKDDEIKRKMMERRKQRQV
ncbi:hypothetical protein RCL1_000740 [Eukaryota sp. TZLM3-RCL]